MVFVGILVQWNLVKICKMRKLVVATGSMMTCGCLLLQVVVLEAA